MALVTYFDLLLALLFGLVWAGVLTFLRLKKEKELAYLLFLTIFYVYLFKVLDYTLFQFQSLVLLKQFAPHLMLQGIAAAESVNLVPLATLALEDLRTSLLNVLLFIPFGFGLPFVTDSRLRRVIVSGMLLSILIELLQLATGLVAKVTFRVADVNDVLFNTAGAVLGYLLFVLSMRVYRHVSRGRAASKHPILRYIEQRPQVRG